jgi:bifunctional NMN adenylyltransferase/nudix hydrolase
LDQDETMLNGMLRELREETRIALSEETLRRCVRSWRTFDDPHRSPRGRTVTTAFRIELRDETSLTKVKGGDDAAKARWVPLSQVSRAAMFEDHYDILVSMGVI